MESGATADTMNRGRGGKFSGSDPQPTGRRAHGVQPESQGGGSAVSRGPRHDRLPARGPVPTISTGASASSIQDSSHQPYFLIPNPQPRASCNCRSTSLTKSTSGAKFGRTVSAAREEAQATAGRLRGPLVSACTPRLAMDYIELRAADAQQRLLDDTVKPILMHCA